METLIILALSCFMLAAALMIIRLRNLFALVMFGSVTSLLSAGLFVMLDAVDVAFTEAAVGAGLTTVLFLGALALTDAQEKFTPRVRTVPLLAAMALAALMTYGALDMPLFGAPDAPAHRHVAPEYLARAQAQTGVPNIVTAVLASYRGLDTLGETSVIFAAGIGAVLLLRGERRALRRGDEE